MLKYSRSIIFIFAIAILGSCVSGSGSAQSEFSTVVSGELSVALYPGFAPVVFHEPATGETVGIDVDILQAFADEHSLELTIVERPFNDIWQLPARGDVDIAGSGISALDSRLVEGMEWSAPYYQVQRSLSIRAEDSGRLQTLDDFGGLTIGYTAGSTGELDTRQRAPASATLVSYEIEEEAIEDLLTGEIDAIARGDVSSIYDATVNPELGFTDLHYFEPREYFVFAVPSDNRSLVESLNEFLVEMENSGTIGRIVDKYLDAN